MVFMPHWPVILGSKPVDLGLSRVLKLLEVLGNPHKKLPPVIHAAGTNGKGSTLAFLASILKQSGFEYHRYTSPHLINFNERITINGNDISDDFLNECLDTCRVASEKHNIQVTFFEGTTVAAFLAFSKIKADFLLLETGLGGRLDATNVIDNPLLTIITSISLDHTEYLGPTLDLIATEKAGIMKKDATCINSLQYDEVNEVLHKRADEKECQILSFGYDWHIEKDELDKNKIIYHNNNKDLTYSFTIPNLVGDHQIINAGNAITASIEIAQMLNKNISYQNIQDGLKKAKWMARLQKISNFPFIDNNNFEVWIDGAHNSSAAHALSSYVKDNWQDKPLILCVGMTKGRDVKEFLSHFKELTNIVIGCNIKTEPFAYNALDISKIANNSDFKNYVAEDISEIAEIINKLDIKNARILITGSLYLCSDVLQMVK